ncbi:MAG TPA: transposase, partial [Candidatus Paceibacterota bacterium]|nr:transposase [Candidatus Paceibacterota bacterium]
WIISWRMGKIANCQVAVSLHWSTCAASCPLAWRLYLPAAWLTTPDHRAAGKIPAEVGYNSTIEIPNASAKKRTWMSVTIRRWVSLLARMSRVM